MFILLFLLIIGLNIYLPWRLGILLSLQNPVGLYVLFAVGLVSGFVARALITRYDNILVSAYYNVAGVWLGILLYLSCLMLIFEIVNRIHPLPPVKAGWTVIILTAIIVVYSFINGISFKVTSITIPVKGLKNEVKIVQISDVHLGAARGRTYLARIVKKTNELKPDFMVITGDLSDTKAALNEDMFTPLKDMQLPVYFVNGNHDVYVGLDKVMKRLKENNVIVMQNEVLVTKGIKLVGLNYMRADDSVRDPHQVSNETMKDILPSLDLSGDYPKIVLHHVPWGIEYLNEQGVDLVLAGHTHGGQMFPFSLLTKAMFPYNKGLAEYNGTYIYVSQGVGTFMTRMRFGTRNEIAFITLTPQE